MSDFKEKFTCSFSNELHKKMKDHIKKVCGKELIDFTKKELYSMLKLAEKLDDRLLNEVISLEFCRKH